MIELGLAPWLLIVLVHTNEAVPRLRSLVMFQLALLACILLH